MTSISEWAEAGDRPASRGLNRARQLGVRLCVLCAIALSVAAALPISAHAQAPIVIDDFNSDQVVADNGPTGAPVSSSIADASVLGGHRNLQVQRTGPAGDNVLQVTLFSNLAGLGIFSFDQQSSVTSGRASIFYDGNDTNGVDAQGLSPAVDLTGGGNLGALELGGLEVVGSGLILRLTMFNDSTGAPSTYQTTLPEGFSGDLLIPFTSFTAPATAANVGALQIEIDGQTNGFADGSDLTLDRIAAVVPEPSTLIGALAALGLFLIVGQHRRRTAAT